MAFNPNMYMMTLKGKEYLPVNARVAWFREEHPDWTILTSFASELSGSDHATFRCDILDPTGRVISTGHKTEHAAHFPDFREKAETGSIGRALALCGYGTLFAQELETPETPSGDLRIVDAPIAPAHSPKQGTTPASPSTADLKSAGIAFKDAVKYFEPNADADRCKQIFRILTSDAKPTVQAFATATSMVSGCADELEFMALIAKLGKGQDAPF